MERDSSRVWRSLFVGGGLIYFVGAFFHPRGMGMAGMLVDPAWIPSHTAVFVGLSLMTIGLVFFRRSSRVSPRMDRWLVFAIVMAILETVEMALHTMAYVDAGALAHGSLHGGLSTPVLTIHIWMATLVYTPFAVAMIGLILMGQRERTLGSPWISWLGLVGAVAHGSVMWLVVVLQVNGAGILFPIYALSLSLWFILAGIWPTRQPAENRASDEHAVGATLVRS